MRLDRHLTPLSLVVGVLAWLVVAVRASEPVQDPDFWWLAWAGRQILAGTYPRTNLGSYTTPHTEWVLHEPLVAVADAAAGPDHIGWIRLALLGATAAMALALASRPRNGWATAFALAPMPVILLFGLSERALAWGNLLLAAVVWCLFSGGVVHRERQRLVAAVALVWVWANTHGSFFLGVGLVTLVHPGWGLVAAATTLANPAGVYLYRLVWSYLGGVGTAGRLGEVIVEWGWLDPSDSTQGLSLLWGVLVGLLLWTGPQPDRAATWRARLLHVLMLALMIRSWRNVPVAGLVLLPFVAARLEQLAPARPLGRPALVFGSLLLLQVALTPPGPPDRDRYPAELLSSVGRDERAWADHELGGWLLWHRRQVFWDGRNDCYPEDVWDDALEVALLREDWAAVLDRWSVGVVITGREALEAELVTAGWTERARAGRLVVLER